jgi:hypothetical protein
MGSTAKRIGVALTFATLALSGCYVVPVSPDGRAVAVHPIPPGPNAPSGASAPALPAATTMTARLYPTNDVAAQHGVLTGSVINHLNGRGEFHLTFGTELLTGEATRVASDARRGVANAYGNRGTYMNCQYQMNSTTQGSGTCTLSNGGRYNLHIGG